MRCEEKQGEHLAGGPEGREEGRECVCMCVNRPPAVGGESLCGPREQCRECQGGEESVGREGSCWLQCTGVRQPVRCHHTAAS